MIDLKKLSRAAAAASKEPGKSNKSQGTATVEDGILTIRVPLVGAEPNESGKSIRVASLSGLRVEGRPGFRQTHDGELIEVPGLVVHVHGGASVYSRDAGIRAALGLSPIGGGAR